MAGPITLLTESGKSKSLRHTHNFLDREQDTRTTFKVAEPKGEKIIIIKKKSLHTATVGAHSPLPRHQEFACVQYWSSFAFLELQTQLFRLVRIYFKSCQTLRRAA